MNDIIIDAFRHNAWATRALIEACRDLSAEALARPAWASDGNEAHDLDRLAARVAETEQLWERLLGTPVDAERLLLLEEGAYEVHAGVVVAQALHHANVHREQIRASLAELGVRPPDLQPWAYADATGRGRWRHVRDA